MNFHYPSTLKKKPLPGAEHILTLQCRVNVSTSQYLRVSTYCQLDSGENRLFSTPQVLDNDITENKIIFFFLLLAVCVLVLPRQSLMILVRAFSSTKNNSNVSKHCPREYRRRSNHSVSTYILIKTIIISIVSRVFIQYVGNSYSVVYW